MGDNETNFDINLRAIAETAKARSDYDELFANIKTGVADALKGEGASPEFIAKAMEAYDELKQEMDTASGSAEHLAAKMDAVAQKLAGAAEAEQRRITQLKLGMQEALREKDLQQEAIELTRRRRQEDQLNSELAELASKKRIAELQMQRELEKSVAEARQMSAEQRIEREVMSRGAYDPREEVDRMRQVEGATERVTQSKRRLRGSIGEAAMQMSYFVDDAQYGLRGIMNNIPILIASLGLGAGLAGVIGIAAVAINVLWEKFGGSKQAKEDTEKVKAEMEALKTSLDAAAKAAEKIYDADTAEYLAAIDAATTAWDRQSASIDKARAAQEAMAAAQQALAEAQIEVERQQALASAGSVEDANTINAAYDLRLANLKRTGREAALQRAQESQLTALTTSTARRKELEGEARGLRGNVQAEDDVIQGLLNTGVGQQSDQARRQRDGDQAMLELAGIERQQRVVQERMNARQAKIDSGEGWGVAETVGDKKDRAEMERLQKKASEAAERRDLAAISRDSDADALRTGKVTFEEAKAEAEKAGNKVGVAAISQTDAEIARRVTSRDAMSGKLAEVESKGLPAMRDSEREQVEKMKLLQLQQEAERTKRQAEDQRRNNEQSRAPGTRLPGGLGFQPAPLPDLAPGPMQGNAPAGLPPSRGLPGADDAAKAAKGAADSADKSATATESAMQAMTAEMERMRKRSEEQERKMKQMESQLKNSRA